MTNTANYNLPQREASDRVKRSDFNAAMQSIDTALAGAAKIATGSYTGTGTCGSSNPTSITFTAAPKLIILFRVVYPGEEARAMAGNAMYVPAFLLWGITAKLGSSDYSTVSYNGNTIGWYSYNSADIQYNVKDGVYYYVAFI